MIFSLGQKKNPRRASVKRVKKRTKLAPSRTFIQHPPLKFTFIYPHMDDSVYMEGVAWSDATLYWEGFVGYIILTFFAFITNLFVFILVLCHRDLRGTTNSLLIALLTAGCGLFSIFCMIQCTENLAAGEMRGHWVGCSFQVFYAISLIVYTGLILCLIALNSYQSIVHQKKLTRKHIFSVVLC